MLKSEMNLSNPKGRRFYLYEWGQLYGHVSRWWMPTQHTITLQKFEKIYLSYLHFPPDLALYWTFCGLNYPCLEQNSMVPKMFEPLKFDCLTLYNWCILLIVTSGFVTPRRWYSPRGRRGEHQRSKSPSIEYIDFFFFFFFFFFDLSYVIIFSCLSAVTKVMSTGSWP